MPLTEIFVALTERERFAVQAALREALRQGEPAGLESEAESVLAKLAESEPRGC